MKDALASNLMSDQDRHQREREIQEAHQALLLEGNALWQQMFARYREALIARMTNPSSTDDEVLETRRMLVAVRRVKTELEQALKTGDLAAMQLETDNARREAKRT